MSRNFFTFEEFVGDFSAKIDVGIASIACLKVTCNVIFKILLFTDSIDYYFWYKIGEKEKGSPSLFYAVNIMFTLIFSSRKCQKA